MIICNTFNEVKLTMIYIISRFDNYPRTVTVEKNEEGKYVVGYEEFNEEEIEDVKDF